MIKLLEREAQGERRASRTRSVAARTVAKAKAARRQFERAKLLLEEHEQLARANRWIVVNDHVELVDSRPAFFPGPRARALLRGKDIAAKDLADSGGSYTLDEVRRLLNSVSRQSIEKRVREGGLLAVIGLNNKRFYPVAQFNDDGSPVEGLRAIQDALATRNGYAVLNFLVNPDPRLDNRRPIDLLKQGEVERVVEAAARVGEQGA